jgi:hypothetical protein
MNDTIVDKSMFTIDTVDDEIRADGLCQELLRQFHTDLLASGLEPLDAGQLAHGADYYLRDFVISAKQENIFCEKRGLIRQFAGNWYIVNTLDPEIGVLKGYLAGIHAFYRYLAGRGLVSPEYLLSVERECNDTSYYEGRITSFWEITGDGYSSWEGECSLRVKEV